MLVLPGLQRTHSRTACPHAGQRCYIRQRHSKSAGARCRAFGRNCSRLPAAARMRRRSDTDYRLLVPLMLNVAIIQAVYAIVRVTTSYRAIELELPVIWLGIISATFAILPIIFAVQVGRFLDRGKDAQAVWIGASLLVIACAGFRFAANSLPSLLLLTALLGISHILIMASQQMLCVRCTGPRGRDSAFGNYVIASAVGQGLGPYLVAWAGGSATLPPTDRLFAIGLDRIVWFAGDRRRHPAGAGPHDTSEKQRRRAAAGLAAPARIDGRISSPASSPWPRRIWSPFICRCSAPKRTSTCATSAACLRFARSRLWCRAWAMCGSSA